MTVITQLPSPTPVTTPSKTVALDVSELDHITPLWVVLVGVYDTVSVSVLPTFTVVLDLFKVNPVIGIGVVFNSAILPST